MPGSPRSVIELMFSSCTDVARVLRGCMPLRSSAVGDINSMAERYGQQLSSMLISPYEGSNTSPLGRMPWIKRLSLRTLRFSSTPIIHHRAIRMQRMHVIEVGSLSLSTPSVIVARCFCIPKAARGMTHVRLRRSFLRVRRSLPFVASMCCS